MTILIKGVQILSGGKRIPDKSDIFISGEKISAIGNFPTKIADYIIDGHGSYVSPGFIDINTDSDHYLSIFSNPIQGDFLRQGVTTIIGGQCGSSLAPLLYGHLDSIRKWAEISRFNVSWHELRELLLILDKKPLGVNFGTLIGHSTIRRDLVGEEIRELTQKELEVFAHVLNQNLSQGGFGLSTGLSYSHSFIAPRSELEYLAQTVRRNDGLYATHLRDMQEGLEASVKETVALVKKTGVKTVMSHFLPVRGREKAYRASLESLEKERGIDNLYFDLSPFSTSILPIYTLLPDWAKKGNLERMTAIVLDERSQKKISQEIKLFDPEHILISRADNNDVLVGRSLRDCMELYGLKTPEEALLRVMATTHLKASVFYENVNSEELIKVLSNPRCLIASNAASLSKTSQVILSPERARRTFPKFLSLVEARNIMPIEEAVQRITETPARILNLDKRGEIKEGYYADLTGFQGGEVRFTIVNGHIAFENQELSKSLAGKILRHHTA